MLPRPPRPPWAAIRAAGLHIRDIATEDPDLEDVFVSLTSAPAPIDA